MKVPKLKFWLHKQSDKTSKFGVYSCCPLYQGFILGFLQSMYIIIHEQLAQIITPFEAFQINGIQPTTS